MRFVLGNRDREERIVEDILEGEDVVVNDEGGNTACVDSFKSSRCPKVANYEYLAEAFETVTYQAGIPLGRRQNLAVFSVCK